MELRARLSHMVEEADEALLRRIARADTSVEFRVMDDPDASVTLLMDRFPPRLASPGDPGEILLELDRSQAERFAAGTLSLAAEIAQGRLPFRGQVRRYLVLDPIIRHALREQA